jgi:hypothetical protein
LFFPEISLAIDELSEQLPSVGRLCMATKYETRCAWCGTPFEVSMESFKDCCSKECRYEYHISLIEPEIMGLMKDAADRCSWCLAYLPVGVNFPGKCCTSLCSERLVEARESGLVE